MSLSKALEKYGVKTCKFDKNAEICIIFATFLEKDSLNLANLVKNNIQNIVHFSAIEDSFFDKAKFIKQEICAEHGVLAMFAKEILKEQNLGSYQEFFDDLDLGYLSAECSVGEEEIEKIANLIKGKKTNLVLGADLEFHKFSENLAQILAILSKFTDINIILYNESLNIGANLDFSLDEIEILDEFDGSIVYSYKSNENLDELVGSEQFSLAFKLQDKQDIKIKNEKRKFKLDKNLKGTIGLLAREELQDGYRFERVKIEVDYESSKNTN